MDIFLFFVGGLTLLSSVGYLIVSSLRKNLVGKVFFSLFFAGVVLSGAGLAMGIDSDTQLAEEETKEVAKEPKVEGPKESPKEVAKPKAKEVEELTPREKLIDDLLRLVDEGKAFDVGSYVKGDIPKGEYAFVPLDKGGMYYSEEDAAGNIVDNEIFDSFGYVYVHGVGNVQTDGVLVGIDLLESLGVSGSKEMYEIIHEVDNFMDSGWYRIGYDLPAGSYTVESYGEGYVAIMSGPIGNSEIVNNEIFNGKYSVNLSDGQHLKISRAYFLP